MAIDLPGDRRHLALATISGAVIAYQLALMQILSLVQWHHFASLIIAVALLGFGAAGTCLALLRPWLMRRFAPLLPLVLCLSGAAMALMPGLAQGPWARFDSLLIFTGIPQILRLLLTCGLYFLPVFLAALAIGMIFVHAASDIGRLYFWNLAGSGAGGAAMTGLMWLFPPAMLPGLAALAAVAAALLVLPEGLRGSVLRQSGRNAPTLPQRPEEPSAGRLFAAPGMDPGTGRRRVLIGAALFSILTAVVSLIHPPAPVLSEFKGLSRALLLPDARITYERSSPYGLMQVFTSPALRTAPGLSLAWQEKIPAQTAVFNNGEWFGAVVPRQEQGREAFMDHTTGALPYALGTRRSVLLLDAGTGSLIPQALGHGAERIVATEPHPVILSLLKGELASETGNILRHPAVSVRNLSARTFLALDSSTYDLIVLPTVDTFGGTSGLQAVTERYLLTREAFRQMWRKLTPGGAISVTCWMDYPLRHPLKILATLAEVLESEGAGEIRDHLAAVRGWGTITILAKKGRLDAADGEKIRRFCRRLLFDPALLPDVRMEERARFNSLQDRRFFLYLDQILSSSRARFIADYPFDIRPATDDRPYFAQFLRWRSIPELARLYGIRSFPFLEAGYLLVLLTLLLVGVASAVLIMLPLRFLRRRGGCRMSTLIYFSGLGIGYMFVEIVLIQRFLLTFGNPIQAAAMVISGMLLFSGVGSLLSARRIGNRKRALTLFFLIILVILSYALVLTPLLQATIALPPAARIFLSLLIIAPAALLMGMPFPLGIRLLAGRGEQEIPWAWGINGCLSVVGSVLATVIAVELGFAWVMILAAMAYAMALSAGWVGLLRPEAFGREG
ncbi:MAG: polyamine aminopropyltransferase [Syntrophales bacterium]